MEEAYFFTVALCRNVDPRSPRGDEVWKLRYRLADRIAASDRKRIQSETDSWLAKVGEGLNTGISELDEEAKKTALRKEEDFRRSSSEN